MTLYEVSEMINSSTANLMTSQTIFLSMVTAYLVVAYTVGQKLTRYQVAVVNVVFVLSMLNSLAGGAATLELLTEQLSAKLRIDGIVDDTYGMVRAQITSVVYVAIRLIFLTACLGFMWQVRHPKTE